MDVVIDQSSKALKSLPALEIMRFAGEGKITKGNYKGWSFPLRLGLQLHFLVKSDRK